MGVLCRKVPNFPVPPGLINQARSNYRFGFVSSTDNTYGCAIKIDKKNRKVEPSDEAKGIVARAYLF